MVGSVWGQVGCERRIEVFVNIQKKYFLGGRGSGGGGGVRVDVNEELMFCENSPKKIGWGGGRWGGRVGLGGQGGCERRIEVFVKIQKIFFFLGGGHGGGVGVGGGGGGGVVRVDVNEELMFCENSPKKIGWGGSVGRSGRVGGSGWM